MNISFYILIFFNESDNIYIINNKLLKYNNYFLKKVLYFIKIQVKYSVTKMAEYIVKSIIKVFCAENSLKNLEKIRPKVFKTDVVAITVN